MGIGEIGMKSYIFELEITGLGETEVEAKNDAIEQIMNGSYSTPNELFQWLDLKRVEDSDAPGFPDNLHEKLSEEESK